MSDLGQLGDKEPHPCPEWGCRRWGDYEHDWLSCPECVEGYERANQAALDREVEEHYKSLPHSPPDIESYDADLEY